MQFAHNTTDLSQGKRPRRKLRRRLKCGHENEWTSTAKEFAKAWEDKKHFNILLNRQAASAPEVEHVHRPTCTAVSEEPPTESEVLECIQMKNGKSDADDGNSAEMPKSLPPSDKLIKYRKGTTRDEQAGFHHGRSTTDHVFIVRRKLSSLQILCSSLTGCSWDSTGVRLALSAENLIWFAKVRPRYKWGYCGHTVVYSYERIERGDYRVAFYETKLDELYSKPVQQLEQLATGRNYCIIASRQEDPNGKPRTQLSSRTLPLAQIKGIVGELYMDLISADAKANFFRGTKTVSVFFAAS
ncbi:hypothetical protein RB195_022977 [Necator americanus]|uniref:IFT121 second beta-propeller domain-containing protein n=1 Tax=Necator americanus TaxID=51031 RepID=A0ABR1EHK2_NECAM